MNTCGLQQESRQSYGLKMLQKLYAIGLTFLILFSACLPASGLASTGLEQQLSNKNGIANLLPSFRDTNGHFKVPDPTENAQAFLTAQQTLTILIDQAESQALNRLKPTELKKRLAKAPTRLAARWKRAEIAVRTDGRTQSCADDGPNCAAYGSDSFLNTLEPVEGLGESFYRSVNAQGEAQALVYVQPTAVPSVSRLLLAAANSAGAWIPAAYALGPAGGEAFMIVNNCLDLAQETNGALKPSAMLVAALQWVD